MADIASGGPAPPSDAGGGGGDLSPDARGDGDPLDRPPVDTGPGNGGADASPQLCSQIRFVDPYTPGYQLSTAVQQAAIDMQSSMILADKVAEMRGGDSVSSHFSQLDQPDNTAIRLKGFRFRNGTRGASLEAATTLGNAYSTAFPVALARAASFDLDLESRVGAAIADETLASGGTALFAPSADLLRHPLWGRAQETYGEDPFVVGRFGSAFTTAVQRYIPACVTHWVGYAQETNVTSVDVTMDEQTLREVYARPFGMVVQDAGVACVVASYPTVNETRVVQNKHLLTDILRSDFAFRGFVISDSWALHTGQSADSDQLSATAADALNAGVDIEHPDNLYFSKLESLLTTGKIRQTQIETAVGRILAQKFRFGIAKTVGSPGLQTPTTIFTKGSITNDETHLALAEEAAEKSAVLLKNDGILPLGPAKTAKKKIAVLGAAVNFKVFSEFGTIDFATAIRTGDLGVSRVKNDPNKSVNLVDGLRVHLGPDFTVVTGNSAADASDSDVVIVVAGLTPQDEGESYARNGDRTTFSLSGKTGAAQDELISAVAALGKPVVVVLEAGGAVETQDWFDKVNAVIMAFYPGQRMGNALARLILGEANFSAKLPITWDTNLANWPAFASGPSVAMDYNIGYSWFDNMGKTPRFLFGSGLSYTTFAYSNIQINCTDYHVSGLGVVNVHVDIQNTGTVAGDEVAFLFVSFPASKVRRHHKELKQFVRVHLQPGEKKNVVIPLRVSDIAYWDNPDGIWTFEFGPVLVRVAGSSSEAALNQNQAMFM